MLFNSLEFFIFLIIVFCLYFCSNLKWQNIILLFASYWFYGSWDWRFLSLIWVSTIIDYYFGIKIDQEDAPSIKKRYLFFSIFCNLLILGFFKYFNFFAGNLKDILFNFGFKADWPTLNIILPVGISFYTFQTMSYTIDIYYGKIKPTKNLLNFALFVAFFPQLVAGPIERARNLLPQIERVRKIPLDQFYEGCYLILWGLFQKVFVADNLAKTVDCVFGSSQPYSGPGVLIALYAFSFQIFCDFAGYSNIARGVSKCMGFNIMVNFNLPYFAANPREFWRRWHISLSTWLKDYLYVPLGGSKKGIYITYRNLMITMLLGGLWHGAAWTFVVWGCYHGFLLVFHRIMVNKITAKGRKQERPGMILLKVVVFFHLVSIGWLIFRAQSFGQISLMLRGLVFNWQGINILIFIKTIGKITPYILFVLAIQVYQYLKNDLLIIYKSNLIVRAVFYYVCIILIIIFGVTGGKEFIYFQF
ncbi:MAG: MBOAT family O-acyltransferase [Candidatus Omnitrophota bacterium]